MMLIRSRLTMCGVGWFLESARHALRNPQKTGSMVLSYSIHGYSCRFYFHGECEDQSVHCMVPPKMDRRILAKMDKFFWLDGLDHLPMLGDFDRQRCPLGLVTIRHLDTFGNSWRFHIWWFCLERNPWVSLKKSSWPNSPLLGLAQVRRTFCSLKLAEDKFLSMRHMESCLLKLVKLCPAFPFEAPAVKPWVSWNMADPTAIRSPGPRCPAVGHGYGRAAEPKCLWGRRLAWISWIWWPDFLIEMTIPNRIS